MSRCDEDVAGAALEAEGIFSACDSSKAGDACNICDEDVHGVLGAGGAVGAGRMFESARGCNCCAVCTGNARGCTALFQYSGTNTASWASENTFCFEFFEELIPKHESSWKARTLIATARSPWGLGIALLVHICTILRDACVCLSSQQTDLPTASNYCCNLLQRL